MEKTLFQIHKVIIASKKITTGYVKSKNYILKYKPALNM